MRFPWNKAESDLEQEIAHHLHHLAAEYERQGYSRDEAMRLAKREFGGGEQIKEQCRDESRWAWLNGFRQDITFGIRMMRRTPVVTVAVVLSLALGIGANTAIVSLMDIVLWRELPVPNPKQLTIINWQGPGFVRELIDGASGSMHKVGATHVADFFSYRTYQSLRTSAAPRANIAASTYPERVSVSYAGQAAIAQQRAVSGNFLPMLQVRTGAGRLLSDSDDSASAPPTVVISHRFWTRVLASDPNAVGHALRINDKPYTVAGVLEPAFYGLFPTDSTDLYVPLHADSTLSRGNRERDLFEDDRGWCFQLMARRAPGISSEQLKPMFDAVFPTTWSRPLKDASAAPRIRLDDGRGGLGFLRQEFRDPFLVLASLVGLLLAIACTNIANLLLSRSAARQREVATRVSLGCSRGRLMRQFLTESALLSILGGTASIVVTYLTANLLGQFLAGRDGAPVLVTLDGRILAMVGFTTALALLLFGLFPAWSASRTTDASWLKEGAGTKGYGSRRKWSTGQMLVLAQMAMSLILVMTAVLFTRNLQSIESADAGFDRRNLVLFGVRPGTSGYSKEQLPGFYYDLERRLADTPGVVTVAFASVRPMNIGGWWERVQLAGQKEGYQASINGVTPSYLPLYTGRMVAGRNITRADIMAEAKVVVISEDLASKLGGPSAVGRRLTLSDRGPDQQPPEFEIVGVAPVIAATSLKERPYVVWRPIEKETSEVTVVLRTSQQPSLVLPAIRQTMAAVDRNLPMVDAMTMEEQISRGLQRERMFATLCSGFGILALILAVVGLYGVIAYSTSRRRGEFGLRLALGAMPGDVVWMVLGEGLRLVALGMLLGAPVLWLGAKYVEKELFKMKPLEPVSMTMALSILITAALVAVAIPALRASKLHPAQALRQE